MSDLIVTIGNGAVPGTTDKRGTGIRGDSPLYVNQKPPQKIVLRNFRKIRDPISTLSETLVQNCTIWNFEQNNSIILRTTYRTLGVSHVL